MMMRWITLLLLIPAISASCSHPREKEGKCINRVFIALVCEPDEVVEKCQRDSDCPGIQKCCQTERCVTECENPAAPRPGECPDPSRVEPGGILSFCEEDTDCGGPSEKCCANSAGLNRCVEPRGTCPDTSDVITTCVVTERNCGSDAECSPDTICCHYGCGKECLTPA